MTRFHLDAGPASLRAQHVTSTIPRALLLQKLAGMNSFAAQASLRRAKQLDKPTQLAVEILRRHSVITTAPDEGR